MHPRRFAVAATVAIVVFVLAVAANATRSATTLLTLDGVPFRPELALDSSSRAKGLMNRRKAPVDGMLFVFPGDTTGSFWMQDTLVPLTIVFFDSQGNRVRRMSMTPCRRDPCPLYSPGRKYRFALELRASDRRPAQRLGPLRKIRHLSRLAD